MLLPELKLNDQTFYLGPNNRLALVGACDANAWLEAIGTLHETGELTFTRVAHDEYRVSGGNNAGISVTWTADGGVLFFNSTRVDPATGQPMDPFEDEPPLRVHAELDDGTLLVSARSTSQKDSFWVLPANAPIDEVPTASPDFIGQASYPAVQVQIDAAGGKAYATFQDWENGRDRTVIVGGSDIRDVTGRVWPSPSGAHLLVLNRETSGKGSTSSWTVVDPEAGTSSPVPLPVSQADKWVTVGWGESDEELLISARDIEYEISVPTRIWLQPIAWNE